MVKSVRDEHNSEETDSTGGEKPLPTAECSSLRENGGKHEKAGVLRVFRSAILVKLWMETQERAASPMAAPGQWNSLPLEARLAPSLLSFQQADQDLSLLAGSPSVTSYLSGIFREICHALWL